MTLLPGTAIGKYVVRRKLAEGGMAEIYLCTSRGPEGFEKEVVIKRVRPFLAGDPVFIQMFIAEARLASKLNHANVVQIFDFDKHEDTFYLAMEYVKGASLMDVRARSRLMMLSMPPLLVAHVGAEVARGLHCAHSLTVDGVSLRLVHRDVSPQNVLLSYDGAVKLTDFGIAKAGQTVSAPGMLKGKFAYMSPEQSRGEELDARSDVFALGVVLWEQLTGGKLFDGDSDVAVLRAVQQSAIPPPARLNPDVAPELDAIVMKALERDKTKRYATAQELEHRLAQFVVQNTRDIAERDLGGFLVRLFDEASVPRAVAFVAAKSSDATVPPRASPVRAPVVDDTRLTPKSVTGTPGDEDDVAATLPLEPGALPPPEPLKRPESAGQTLSLRPSPKRRIGILGVAAAAGILALLVVGGWVLSSPKATSTVTAEPAPLLPPSEEDAVVEGELSRKTNDGRVDEPVAPPVAPRAKARGTLLLQVSPYAQLTLNGRNLGEVEGSRKLTLSAGKHRVRLVHPLKTDDAVVMIEEGRATTHRFSAQ